MAFAAYTDNLIHGICLEVLQHAFYAEGNYPICYKEPCDPMYRFRPHHSLCIAAR